MPDTTPRNTPDSSASSDASAANPVPAAAPATPPGSRWQAFGTVLIIPGMMAVIIGWAIWKLPPEQVHNETMRLIRAQHPGLEGYYTRIDQCDYRSPDPLRIHRCRHQLLMAMTDEREIAATLAYEKALDAADREGKVYRSYSMKK